MYSRIGIACVLVCLGFCVPAWAGTIEVTPTGTMADINNVKAAIDSAHPGDVILLKAGTFDWSGNSMTFPPFIFPLGLPITVSDITITGETNASGDLLTEIAGPVDGDGTPTLYAQGIGLGTSMNAGNAAFVNGPGVTGVTIQNLRLMNFEQAIVLLQDPGTVFMQRLAPGADFSEGADDFVIQKTHMVNVRAGIGSRGANDRVIIRQNRMEIVKKDGASRLAIGATVANVSGINFVVFGTTALGVEPPSDLVIENNLILGPGPELEVILQTNGSTLGLATIGIGIQGGFGARVEANSVERFSRGISFMAEGATSILRNSVSSCQNGVTLMDGTGYFPGFLGVETKGVLVRNNQFVRNVYLPFTTDSTASLDPASRGVGIALDADDSRFLGNNVELNEVAGILLYGDEATPAHRTAIGNIILGNKNVVGGSEFVLSNNTISGSQKSLRNVGQVVSQLQQEDAPPIFH